MVDSQWMAGVNGPSVAVTQIASGTYRVEHEGRNEMVYVAGSVTDRWSFWNGQVFGADGRAGKRDQGQPTTLTAPMPARVIRILVQAGSAVTKGETLVVLEAMKMELPIRAPANGRVAAVHCREGELVQADAVLLELGPP